MKARKKPLKHSSSGHEAAAGVSYVEANVLRLLPKHWLPVLPQVAPIDGLRNFAGIIQSLAQLNDKRFFIELGKALSVKTDETALCDPITRAVMDILSKNPRISAKDALRRLGRPDWREETFRERKYRL